MAIPLVVLAIGSVVTGWVNIPGAIPVLPEFTWLHHFLHPAFAPAEEILVEHLGEPAHAAPFGGGEGLWAILSTTAAILVVIAVFSALRGKRYAPAREAMEPSGLWRPLYRKWWMDEIYDRMIVRPFRAVCRFSWRIIDQGVVDGLGVNGTAYVTRFGGWVISRFQTGFIGTYVLIIVIGVLIVLGAAALQG